MNLHLRAFIFCLLSGALLGSCSPSPNGGCQSAWMPAGERLLGNQAPDFTIPNLAGEKVVLSKLSQEKPTLLVFWASWCPTCNEEIPVLNQWAGLYPDLQIVGVNVQEPAERVRTFVKKRNIRYAVLLDEEGEVAEQYGLVGIPASVLLAKGGKIIYYGFSLPQDVDQLIKA